MCGIAGELRFSDQPSEANWPRLSLLMARRGPDDSGYWGEDPRCTLVFRRLSILDLSAAARQPMLDASGRFALVFNGEMYNYRELRAHLEKRGVRFRSSGDAEVVLYTLIEHHLAALDLFNGMFALAFYDRESKMLLLARDHAGIKPLYTMITGQGAVFASQYDQILIHPWSRSLRVSADALGLYLRQGYIPAPYALLEQTAMLEPGSWLLVSAEGETRQGRYYEFPKKPEPGLAPDEATDAIDAAIGEAVRRQMVSDVPLGVFLSGGIDSPLVAAKLQQASRRPAPAFTIGTDDPSLDETADAAAYARELGLAHTVERIPVKRAMALLNDAVTACGEPFADYSLFPTMLVSELARRTVTVMLSGDGGDELFWGYPQRFGSVIRSAAFFQEPVWMRKLRGRLKKLPGGREYPDGMAWPSIGDWYRAKHSHLPEDWLKRILPRAPAWPAGFGLFCYDGSSADETAYWLRWNEYTGHLSRVLLKVDRASMYHSLEVRVPLLDRQVVDLAARVDWRTCLDTEQGAGKIPLRRSLARHVQHQSRGKRGFAVPMDDWLREGLKPLFIDQVLSKRDLMGLEVDQAALNEMFRLHLNGQRQFGWALWILLSLVLWEERYFAGHPANRECFIL